MLKRVESEIVNGLNNDQALIGIHDLYEEGDWVTIFGEPFTSLGYATWSAWGNQPDNDNGNQNCAALRRVGDIDDVNCNDKYAYFCELPVSC